jgi:TolB-like protein
MFKCFQRIIIIFSIIFIIALCVSCGTPPPSSQPEASPNVFGAGGTGRTGEQSGSQRLEDVVRNSARVVESSLSQGTVIAIISFNSPSEAFSEYVIGDLSGEFVNGRKLTVVDRGRAESARRQANLQITGEAGEQTAQAIGRQLGAQSVITGNLINMGTYYRFIVNIISVESAATLHRISFNLQNNARVAFLLGETPEVTEMPVEAPLPLPEEILPVVQEEEEESSFSEDFSWGTRASLFFLASDNGKVGADPPAIVPSFGFSVTWQFWGPLRLEFTEDLYFTNYEYNSELEYPMACNPENRSAFVLGFVTGIQASALFPISKKGVDVRVYGGPAVDFRLVTLAIGLNHPDDFTGDIETDAQMQTDAIAKYFWDEGRWLLPVAGVGMDFPITENFLLGFDLRCWFPLYRLWTDEQIPAIDGWRFGAGLHITPRPKKKVPGTFL